MKSLLFAVALLVIGVPLTALAFKHDNRYSNPPSYHTVGNQPFPPQPTPAVGVQGGTPPTGASYQNCTNYGYQPLVNGKYDLVAAQADLTKLKAAGITCVRDAFYGPNPTWAYPLYQLEVSDGFYVLVGADSDPTASNYASGVVAFAMWAQANGIKSFAVGNEDAKNASTVQTIDNLSCKVAAVFHGQISYDTYLDSSFDEIKAYAQNKGCLTALGLNVYADYGPTFSEAQQYWGTNWYLSEFNVDMDYYSTISDSTHASMLQSILSTLAPYNVQKYYFAYDAGGDGVALHWGLQNSPLTAKVLGL